MIGSSLSATLEQMAGFRNLVVNGCEVVDLGIVRDVVENRLDDLLAFVAEVDGWLDS